MKEKSKNYIDQYKLLFYLSWIILYFIFPAWRFYHINHPFTNKLVRLPLRSEIVLLIYFLISAYILNLCCKSFFVNEPLISNPRNLAQYMRNNLWLVVVCSIAAVLHAFTYLPVYSPSVKYSLWIYNFMTYHWHRLFHFPIQYPIWLFLIFLILVIKQKKLADLISSYMNSAYLIYKSNRHVKLLFMVLLSGIFILYTRLLPYYSGIDHALITGYPPLGTVIYLIVHLLFGIGYPYLGPSLIQLLFYILSGVFLYRTINMFYEKELALLGASVFLFSPFVFAYAALAHLSSGVAFFIISVSYFFLKFIKDEKNKDLILTVFFISTGYLYKHDILIMLFVCGAYLIFKKIKQKDFHLISSLKLLSLPVLSFIPWYLTGAKADNTNFSNFTTLESLSSCSSMILSQISWPIFILFLLSIIFVFFTGKKQLSLFFGLVFISYYSLYTMVQQQSVHRYSIAFYPTISVFLGQFVYSVVQKIRWRHANKMAFSVLIIYLAVLCIIPRSSTKLITFKYSDFEIQLFPADEAIEWILNETGNDEKVLQVFFGGDAMPLRRVKTVPENKLVPLPLRPILNEMKNLPPPDDFKLFRQYLKQVCKEQKISYIIFPGGGALTRYPIKEKRELEIRKFLEDEQKYDDFVVAAKFNIGDNYIYIYKLRDGFIERQ